jgi:beta-N-acetylhexosaminidase
MPVPTDQTPADTSSTVTAGLAPALRGRLGAVDEIVVAHAPGANEIAAVRDAVRSRDLVVIGTTAALVEPAQAALVNEILGLGVPTVTVALRTPFDLAAYPGSRSHVSTYGILRPSMEALAAAMIGQTRFEGHLPAAIPGLYPTGHGVER